MNESSFNNSSFIDVQAPYISMSSNSIMSNNLIEYPTLDNINIKPGESIPYDLMKRGYIVLYFEFHFFLFWGHEFIKGIYPDNKLIIIFELNDDPRTQQRIELEKSDKIDEKSKYKPVLSKEDQSKVILLNIELL